MVFELGVEFRIRLGLFEIVVDVFEESRTRDAGYVERGVV